MTSVTKDGEKPRRRRTGSGAKSGAKDASAKSAKKPRADPSGHDTPADAAPEVSVIIPARDEESRLAACLASVATQQGVRFEMIVVDDHSSDRTADIARAFRQVRVVSADPLAEGWCGKQNALHTGVRHARGEWLLFTDADTVHLAGSLARALDEAREHGADLLSYSPAQQVETFLERAVMPVVFAELAGVYRPREVCDPASPLAAANGQYLLVRRDAYEAVGGHAACAATLLDDVELARRVKQSGRRLRFRFGGDAVRTRMYRGFDELRDGWTKNLALLFPDAGDRAAHRAAEFALIAGGAGVAMLAAAAGHRKTALLAGTLAGVCYARFRRRIAVAHFDASANAAAIAGLPLFAYLLLRSARHYREGSPISWKGRQYRPALPHASADAAAGQT